MPPSAPLGSLRGNSPLLRVGNVLDARPAEPLMARPEHATPSSILLCLRTCRRILKPASQNLQYLADSHIPARRHVATPRRGL